MFIRIITATVFVFGVSQVNYAQSSILQKYIEEGIANNLSVKANDLEVSMQKNVIAQANTLWKPKLDFNGSYLLATGGRTLQFPIGDLFNPTYATLNQLTGTEQFPTNLENVNTQLTPNNFIDAQLNASKPLINSAIKYNQKIQNQILKITKLDKNLTQRELKFDITQAYYNYLKSYKGIATLDESIVLLNELLDFNKTLVKYHKATKEVISDVEYRIADIKSQKVAIQEQQILAKSLLNLLVNRDLEEDVRRDPRVLNNYKLFDEDLASLKETARLNRTELKQIAQAEKLNALNTERIEKEGNPQLALFGGVGIQVEEFSLDGGGPLYTAGLSMSMNLIDGGNRKRRIDQIALENEKLRNDQAQLFQKIDIELTQLYYQIKTIESQIASTESALKSAEESYQILNTKYENDKLLLIELLQAENRITTTKLRLDILKYDHLIKQAEIRKSLEAETN